MNHITFVVKGDVGVAREHVAIRGIDAKVLWEVCKGKQTVFKAGMEYANDVYLWHRLNPAILNGYGYPDGTCLLYSVHPCY